MSDKTPKTPNAPEIDYKRLATEIARQLTPVLLPAHIYSSFLLGPLKNWDEIHKDKATEPNEERCPRCAAADPIFEMLETLHDALNTVKGRRPF